MREYPGKEIISEIAIEMGIEAAFVEKDWYMVQVLEGLAQANVGEAKLIFSGGTALAKGHGLIERFSKDIDFRVITEEMGRGYLSSVKEKIVEKLKEQGFGEIEFKAKNKNRFFYTEIKYLSEFKGVENVRTHILLEFTVVKGVKLKPVELAVSSLVSRLKRETPEVRGIKCLNEVENASDKLSALCWRIAEQEKRGRREKALLRHVYDLVKLKERIEKEPRFAELAKEVLEADGNRVTSDNEYATLEVREKLGLMLRQLKEEPIYEQQYREFVDSFCYGEKTTIPTFNQALESLALIVKRVLGEG